MLYFIGSGLWDENDLSLRAVGILKQCKVYLESYTSKINFEIRDLERLIQNKVILANRELVEQKAEETILRDAEKQDVAFLIVGDPFSATTHVDLFLRARKKGIKVEVMHNASILTAVGEIGLELYKYGRTSSIPFDVESETPYNAIKENKRSGLHTLLLLDLRPDRYMTISEVIEYLIKIENKRQEGVFTRETLCVACGALGTPDAKIKAGKAGELAEEEFKTPPFCLVVPGKLHFMEDEMLELWKLKKQPL